VQISASLIIAVNLCLTFTEQASFLKLLFEVTSAFGTVGLSTGITPTLSCYGKLLITLTIFAGRVGTLTLLLSIALRPLTTLILKEMGVKYIIAKADNALHGKMLEKIGADRIVYPERDMGARIVHNLMSSNVIDYIELARNLVGMNLKKSNIRAVVIAIKREKQLILSPDPLAQFNNNDILVLVGDCSSIQRFEGSDGHL